MRRTSPEAIRFDQSLAMIELRYMVGREPLFQSALSRLGKDGMLSSDPNLRWLFENGWIQVARGGWVTTATGDAVARDRRHCHTCSCRPAGSELIQPISDLPPTPRAHRRPSGPE